MIHLHGQSHYSLLNGIGAPERILSKAKELDMKAIGISDLGAMYGGLEFYEKSLKAGVKAIIGVEICLVNETHIVTHNEPITNIILIAKNIQGYQNLLEIVSFANLEGFKERARIDLTLLKKYKEGLLCIVGGLNSKVAYMITQKERQEIIIDFIQQMKSILGSESVFLELIAQNEDKIKAVKGINKQTIEIANQTGTILCISNCYHYVNKDEKKAFEALNCIKEGIEMNVGKEMLPGEHHIMSEEEIIDVMKNNGYNEEIIQQTIQNNEIVANMVDLKIPLGQTLFPKYESPENIVQLYENIKDQLVIEE